MTNVREHVLPQTQRWNLAHLTDQPDLTDGDRGPKVSAFWTMLTFSGVIAIAGVVLVVGIGLVASLALPNTTDLLTNSQTTGRTSPTLVDLIAAVATGDAAEVPLDLGRTERLFTGPQRKAVIAHDRECAWPDCHAHARWCHIHHLTWWQRDGGVTSVENGAQLCNYHHHEVHRLDLTLTQHTITAGAEPGDTGIASIARVRYEFTDPTERKLRQPAGSAEAGAGSGPLNGPPQQPRPPGTQDPQGELDLAQRDELDFTLAGAPDETRASDPGRHPTLASPDRRLVTHRGQTNARAARNDLWAALGISDFTKCAAAG